MACPGSHTASVIQDPTLNSALIPNLVHYHAEEPCIFTTTYPNGRRCVTEAHALVTRRIHKAQNSPSLNNVCVQLLLNRVSTHSIVSFLQTYGRNKCKKHMLSCNPFSFPPHTCFCPPQAPNTSTAGRNKNQEITIADQALTKIVVRK